MAGQVAVLYQSVQSGVTPPTMLLLMNVAPPTSQKARILNQLSIAYAFLKLNLDLVIHFLNPIKCLLR